MKILVVEDEVKLAEYLHKGLTEEGFVFQAVSCAVHDQAPLPISVTRSDERG